MNTKGNVQATESHEDVWIPSQCWACLRGPCSIEVNRVDGLIVNVRGNRSLPHYKTRTRNRGTVCPKPFTLIQKHYSPYRIKKPLKRTNPEKGIGIDPKWVELEWEEALDIVGEKFKAGLHKGIYWSWGVSIMGQLGPLGALVVCFAQYQDLFGGFSLKCGMADHNIGNMIHGAFSCKPDLDHCNYLLVFGNNPSGSGGAAEGVNFSDAYARGMKTVLIDPVLTQTGGKVDEWVPIRPGTDQAFLLAMIQVIANELNMIDEPFLKRMTNAPYLVGPDGYFIRDREQDKALIWDPADDRAKPYDAEDIKDFALEGTYQIDGASCKPSHQMLKDHVRQYTPEWAEKITDIPATTIRRIATEFAENAMIGSTITIGDTVFPHRPVSTVCGRGITGNTQAYLNSLANHVLAALVGALEVPGGHLGGRAEYLPFNTMLKDPSNRRYGDWGVYPGKDGMNKIESYPWEWPPASSSGIKTLVPFSRVYGHLSHLAYKHISDPPKDFPVPEPLDVLLLTHSNPLVNTGEIESVSEGLKKIPFIVQMTYTENETSDFADVILPQVSELETFEPVFWFRNAGSKKLYYGNMLRQPVVKPQHGMDVFDLCSELAERMGALDIYNEILNAIYGIEEPHKLVPGKKYDAEGVMDAWCKSATNSEHDLKWFKENGGLLDRETTEKEQYDVHLKMESLGLRYPIPYFERVKEEGDTLNRHLAEKNIDWWSTREYVPLPEYFPHVLDEVPGEYDFYVTTVRNILFGLPDIPWSIEMSDHMLGQTGILMNEDAAIQKGISDGDEVWLESEVGRQKQKVKLVQGIRPDTVAIMGQFGMWKTPIAKDTGWASTSALTPVREDWTDHVTSNMQGCAVKAKIYKT